MFVNDVFNVISVTLQKGKTRVCGAAFEFKSSEEKQTTKYIQ